MNWYKAFRCDVRHYQRYDGASAFREIVMQQGLWALLQYRIASAVYRSRLPRFLKTPVLSFLWIWRKLIEITTGICLPHAARIGPGLYLNHFGPIIVNKDVVIGSECDISNGVTIGISGPGDRRGVPIIGDCVYIGPCATVAGKIRVGDKARISANSLVTRDVPEGTLARGVPAVVLQDAPERHALSTES